MTDAETSELDAHAKEGRPSGFGVRPDFSKDQWLWLMGITTLAAFLRFYKIGDWAFWIDEAHTYRDMMVSWDVFWESGVSNYPLSYLLLRFLSPILAAHDEGWLRLPFALVGILSVPLLALVARNFVGRNTAIVASLLFALCPWHIYWSQNARSYALVVFFGMLACGLLFRAFVRRSLLLGLFALLVTAIAGLMHPSAYLLLGAFVVYGALYSRRRVRLAPKMQSNLGYRSLRAIFKKDQIAGPMDKWMPLILIAATGIVAVFLLPLLESVIAKKGHSFALGHLLSTTIFFVRVPLLIGAVGGILLMFDREESGATYLACWAFIPLVTLAVIGGFVKVTAQYAIYTLPAFCILSAVTVAELAQLVGSGRGFRLRLLRIVPLGILLFDLSSQSYLYFQKTHGERPLWRDASRFIERRRDRQELEKLKPLRVLTTNGPSMRYYMDRQAFDPDAAAKVEIVPIVHWELHSEGKTPED